MKLLWFFCVFYLFVQKGEGKIEPKKIYDIFSVSNFSEYDVNYTASTFQNVGFARKYIRGNHVYLYKSILSSKTPDNIITIPTLYRSPEDSYRKLFTYISVRSRDVVSYKKILDILSNLSENNIFIWYIDSKPIDPHLQSEFFNVLASKKILFAVQPIGDREFTRSPEYLALQMTSEFFISYHELEEKERTIQKYKDLLANPDSPYLFKRQQEQIEETNRIIATLLANHVSIDGLRYDSRIPNDERVEIKMESNNYKKWIYFLQQWNVQKNLSTFVYDIVNASKDNLIDVSYAMKIRYDMERNSSSILSNYSLVISSQPDSIQNIDSSVRYSAKDFRKLLEPFSNVTSVEPLKGLLKALQIAPPDSQIVFLTNVNPKLEYHLLPDVLDIMIDKRIQIIINKIDEVLENNVMHEAYQLINEMYNQNLNPQF